MTKKHSVSAEVAHMRADIKGKTNPEIEEMYGIQIHEDGSVFDVTEQTKHKNLLLWMQQYASSLYEDDEEDDEYSGYYNEDEG